MRKTGVHSQLPKVPGDEETRQQRALSGVERPPRELLDRVRNRDPEALEAFFDLYFKRIYALTYRLLGDREAAEDVTQEVFFRVQRAAERLDPDRDPAPWLTAIACNTCRKFWSSKSYTVGKKTASLEDTPGLEERLSGGDPDPEAERVVAEREKMVQEAIEELPVSLREAVVMHAYQGMGHDEIAEATGVTHAAARKRYSRAMAELGKKLKGLIPH